MATTRRACGDLALERLVSGHTAHIFDLQLLERGEDPRRREAAVEAYADARVAKGALQLRHEPAQQRKHALRLARLPRAQPGVDQPLLRMVVDGQEAEQRQVAGAVVEAVEERKLLRTVDRVVGAVEVESDEPGLAVLPPQAADGLLLEADGRGMELMTRRSSLEAGQGRLAAEPACRARLTSAERLQNRVAAEDRGVAPVGEAGGEPRGQAELAVDGSEQQAAAIGALQVGVEGDLDGLGNQAFEKDGMSGRMGHAGVLVLANGGCLNHPIGRKSTPAPSYRE